MIKQSSTKRVEDGTPDTVQAIIGRWKNERPQADLSGLLIALWITRLGKLLDLDFSATFRDAFGLQVGDMRLLFALGRSGPPYAMRPTDLFRALLVTSGAVTKQVDRLCQAGLVVRKPDPDHAGGFLIGLTKKGKRTADAAIDQLVGPTGIAYVITEALHSFESEEQEIVNAFFYRLLTAVEQATQDRQPRK